MLVMLIEMEDESREQVNRHFIISAKSKKLTVLTGQPPEPPSNLGVLASTCHSLQIGWDPPRERGVEVKRKFNLLLIQYLFIIL